MSAPYEDLKGVHSSISGYIGGRTSNPTYKQVCSGDTGHAEAVRVTYDPCQLPLSSLLDVFFTLHDPTQLNRQGNDFGTQYRSAVFFHTPEQRAAVVEKIAALEASGKLGAPVVTQVEDATPHTWYPAEDYHQCYVKNNPTQGYVRAVSIPKYEQVRRKFPQLFK